jgi:ATP-dependent DNA ligase
VPGGNSWDVVTLGNDARLVFVIFDVLEQRGIALCGRPYRERRTLLLDTLREYLRRDQTAISTVESLCPSWKGIEALWARGGEGVIVKRLDSTYRPGARSADWIKVKTAHAATLTIIGFAAGKCGPHSVLRLRDAAGVETTVKTLGNALLRDITRAPTTFIGRRVVIAYQAKTPTGAYRHGIFDHFAGDGE